MEKEELIARIKECGQSLIDNAESIVGNEKTLQKINIDIDVDSIDRVPTINIRREIIPEKWLERIAGIDLNKN